MKYKDIISQSVQEQEKAEQKFKVKRAELSLDQAVLSVEEKLDSVEAQYQKALLAEPFNPDTLYTLDVEIQVLKKRKEWLEAKDKEWF